MDYPSPQSRGCRAGSTVMNLQIDIGDRTDVNRSNPDSDRNQRRNMHAKSMLHEHLAIFIFSIQHSRHDFQRTRWESDIMIFFLQKFHSWNHTRGFWSFIHFRQIRVLSSPSSKVMGSSIGVYMASLYYLRSTFWTVAGLIARQQSMSKEGKLRETGTWAHHCNTLREQPVMRAFLNEEDLVGNPLDYREKGDSRIIQPHYGHNK